MKSFLIATTIVILMAELSLAKAGDAEILRFKSEYPSAVHALKERFSTFRGTFRYSEQGDVAKDRSRAVEVDFAITRNLKKSITHRPAGEGLPRRDEVMCINERDTFRLERKGEAQAYFLKTIQQGKGAALAFDGGYGRFLKSSYCLVGRSLAAVMDKSEYKILSAEPSMVDGHELMRVELEFGKSPRYPATILFDPSMGWAICESEVTLTDMHQIKITTKLNYRRNGGNLPVPTSIECIDIDTKRKKCDFLSIEFGATPARDFELEFFGLPNLNANKTPNGQYWFVLWLAGISFVGLIISYVIRRKLRSSASC